MKHVVSLPLFTQQPLRYPGQDGRTDRQTTFVKVKGWMGHAESMHCPNPGVRVAKSSMHRASLLFHGHDGGAESANDLGLRRDN